jgi:hypothetical protein
MPRNAPRLTHPIILAAGLLLLAAAAAHADARLAPPAQPAQAALDFRIVVPPVVRLLENSHPDALRPDGTGRLAGRQTLVLLSNLKRGACVMLRPAPDAPPEALRAWRAQTLDDGLATLQPAGDGWRLCTQGPGRHTLRVQHEFEATSSTVDAVAPAWPVRTELAAI